jgi:hypothetical protein
MPIWKANTVKDQDKRRLSYYGASQTKKAYALKLLKATQEKKGK